MNKIVLTGFGKGGGDEVQGNVFLSDNIHNTNKSTAATPVSIVNNILIKKSDKATMIADETLEIGNCVQTIGTDSLLDGYPEKYIITDTPDSDSVLLNNGLYAKQIPNPRYELVKELLMKSSGLEFDWNLLYIQDVGTKQEFKCYFDKNNMGIYRCLNTTDSVDNTADNFVNISPNQLYGRLEYGERYRALYSNPIFGVDGGATVALPLLGNYQFGAVNFIMSQVPPGGSGITHNQYTMMFSSQTGMIWNTQSHPLGTIAVRINGGSVPYLIVSGTASKYCYVTAIWGIKQIKVY